MNKIKIAILFLCLFFCPQCFAYDKHIPIRVGISDTNFQSYLFSQTEFLHGENLTVTDSATGYTVPYSGIGSIIKVTNENNLFRIYVNGELVARNLSGPITVTAREGAVIAVKGIKRKGKQAVYRGIIELVRSEKDYSKFSIVNVLSLQNYLRGVVPNEMPVRFGLEALKAQTVAARNYAVAPRVKAYKEFDLCDSVACQVYFGAGSEETLSDKAINETDGIIAADGANKPILALYSSTAGGYTESYKFAFSDPKTKIFPSEDISYLSAVPDMEMFGDLSYDDAAENFYMTSPDSYDINSPYYRWSKEWSEKELEGVLAKTLVAQSKTGFVTPALYNSSDFGKLLSVKVISRGKSGKAIKVAVTTDRHTFYIQKELVIRRCFQKSGVSLPSANFVITKISAEHPIYKFNGGGFGHGVGLSQWGAGRMGSLGFGFEEILKHYYTGISLITLPLTLTNNGKHEDRRFYTEQPYAYVHIENKNAFEKIKITVNDTILTAKLSAYDNIVDISKYLQKGENFISYEILSDRLDFGTHTAGVFLELNNTPKY